MKAKATAIIVAGGRSERFNSKRPKQFTDIFGKPLLAWTIEQFELSAEISAITLVVPEQFIEFTREDILKKYKFNKVTRVIAGGKTRAESVFNGLNALADETQLVAIHDGARSMVHLDDIKRVVESAGQADGAILAEPITDTIKQAGKVQAGQDRKIEKTLERSRLFLAQTPQVFRYNEILKVHEKLNESGYDQEFTDDSSMMEKNGYKINLVVAKHSNFKVTRQEDLLLMEIAMKRKMKSKI